MVINKYLVQAFKDLGKQQKDVISDLEKSQPYVSALMRGKKVVGKDIAKLLHNLYGFDEGAILTGVVNTESDIENDTLTNTNGNTFVKKEDGSFNVTVKLMPFDAYASYVEHLEGGEVTYVNDWEDVTFNVSKYGRGNYMAFRIKGDSMNGGKIKDTPDNSLVLGRELGRQHWLDGFNPTDYGWIILCKKNIFHKDIINLDKDRGVILCHSRNQSPEYSDFEIPLNDVYQIFKVIKRTF